MNCLYHMFLGVQKYYALETVCVFTSHVQESPHVEKYASLQMYISLSDVDFCLIFKSAENFKITDNNEENNSIL